MRRVAWVLAGLTLLVCPFVAWATPRLVLQETSRQPVSESLVSIEASIMLGGLDGVRAVEVKVQVPQGHGEELSLEPQSPAEGAVLFPPKVVGDPASQVFAVVIRSGVTLDSPEELRSLGSLRCVQGLEEGDPAVTALGVLEDRSQIEIPVTYLRVSGREPGEEFQGGRFLLVPNPALSGADIHYRVEARSEVEITVFDLRGRKVRRIFSGEQERGERTMRWDGRDDGQRRVPLGIYFLKLRVGSQTRTERLVLMR